MRCWNERALAGQIFLFNESESQKKNNSLFKFFSYLFINETMKLNRLVHENECPPNLNSRDARKC